MRLLCIPLGLTMLAGCEDLDRLLSSDPVPTVRVERAWDARHSGYANVQPAVARDLVFVGTGEGQVIARSRITGTQRWVAQVASRRMEGANLVARSGVVIAPAVFHTTALDAATGSELWRYRAPLDTVGGGPPNPGTVANVRIDADEEAAYIAAWGGTIAAVELRSGRVQWTWQPEPEIPYRFGAEGVTVSGSEVFATIWHALDTRGSQCEGWVVALDARTGRQLWRTTLPTSMSMVCTAGRPAVTADRVIAMLISGELFGLDRRTGQIAWRTPQERAGPNDPTLAVLTSPAVADDIVYADAGNYHLRALRASDGKLLWRTRYEGQFKDDLLITEHRIYAPGGQLYVFDRRTGAWLGMLGQPGKTGYASFFPASPVADPEGRIFAPYEGGLMAFSVR